MSSTKVINRMTLFKIPSESDREKLLGIYKTLQQTALKDGKPYILSLRAGHAFPDQRSQGYTLAIFSNFASVEDMKYYDDECEAHKALKAVAKDIHQGAMTVYFENVV